MSKAEESAFKTYPFIDGEMSKTQNANAGRMYARNIFKKGYEQAEKDLELTWEDINIIINAFLDYKIESVKNGKDKKYTDEEYCKEVLKRFLKERREK